MNDELFDNLILHAFSEYDNDIERMRFIDMVLRIVQDDPDLIKDHSWDWIARSGGFRRDGEQDAPQTFDWQIGQKRY